MTRQKKDGRKLLEVWQEVCGGEEERLRALVEHVVQRVLEEEMTSFLGAEAYERSEERRGYRNGYKPRVLKTRVGRLELMVPKDREGRFQTELFERYQRSEKALLLSIAEMYVQGVSTRKVAKITEELCGLEISKSQVSELAKGLDGEIEAWRNRPLEGAYPYLVVDARYEKVRRGGRVVSQGVLIVVGIREDGYREILGVWLKESENEASWSEVFLDLRERGLSGVRYVVSDDHTGLRKAIERYFQGVMWQRCQVHFIRNVLSRVKKKDRSEVVELVREITEAHSLSERSGDPATSGKAARDRLVGAERKSRSFGEEVGERLEGRYGEVGAFLEERGEEILAVYHLPVAHRKRLRSTNMLERLNQELKRRTRVVRIFPNEAACVRLVCALAIEMNEEWLERRYLTMTEEGDVNTAKNIQVA